MSQDHSSPSNSGGIWYTYFGKGGSSVVAFLWILSAMIWIFYVLKWG